MGKVVDALIGGTPLGKVAFEAIGIDAWWEVSVGKYIREALIPIPADDFGNEAMQQQQMLRSPTEARRSIYGQAMVSGPIVFAEETGTDNEFLHLVIPLAAHQCEEVLEIYFDDEVIYQNGNLDGEYSDHARINIHLGAQTTVDSQLLSECEHWTAEHVGLGITYLYVRLKHDPEFYSNGLPNIKALLKGKPLYDPRKDSSVGGTGNHSRNDESTWEWSDNWALCVLDYTGFESGVGALANEIDLASYALAANDSDQLVEYDDDGHTEKRYTCNGTFTQSMTPASVLDKLLTAGAGMQTYSSGQYQLFSGVYQGPFGLTLSERDLAGEVEVRPFNARAQLCNAVRGTFVDPDNFYQPTDFAPYESNYYRAQDNDEYIDHDIDLPFTQSVFTAQRLAKLYLELNRAGQQIVVPLNMIGLSVSVGQVIELELPRLGIKAEYQVMDWSFDFGLPIKVTLRETHPNLFVFDKGSYTNRKLTPVLNLPSSKRVPTVNGLVWTPMGDDANWQGQLTWNAPGGNSAYRYRLEVSDAFNIVVYQVTLDGTQHHVPKLDAGNYTVTLWAVNLFANRSNIPAIMAIGADAPPAITGILVDAGALELTLRPQTAAVTATSTEFEIKGGLSSNIANAVFIGQGKEVIWPDRHANTEYFVWARATNNYGFSPWFGPIITQTSSDKSALVELLGDTFEKFTWFAWADDNQGNGFTTVEAIGDGKAYMGLATDKKTVSPSGNWQDYTWSKIKTEIPPVFTDDEQSKLDDLMAGKLPNTSEEMLSLQAALNSGQLNNDLLTAQKLLEQNITAAGLGGETPAQSQAKANSAQAAAEANAALDALSKVNTAKSQAIVAGQVDASAKANAAQSAAETYALAKANLAKVEANAYADGEITKEETRAIADAQAKAYTAKSQAISTASADATAKANAAKAAAETYALAKANLAKVEANAYADGEITKEETRAIADAQAKANTAKSQAISTASADATAKANTAKLQAVGDIAAGQFQAKTGLITTLFSSSGLFGQLQARLAAFGGLTANSIASLAIATHHLKAGAVTSDKITVSNAFITKLIANSGLFGHLQAQFAQFGGLAANSIAAKAITVDKLDVLARNLINNVSQTGVNTGWTGNLPVVSHTHKGKPTKALQNATSGNTQLYSNAFEVDHTKIYEVNFTIFRVSGGNVGTRFFGMRAVGDSNVRIIMAESRLLASSTDNFYFWSGDIADGQYHQMRGYIVGSEVSPASIPDSLNVQYAVQLNPGTTKVYLRALNYYNAGVTTVDRWFNMSVTELGGGQISANQLLANTGLFNQLKARIANFGGLTATEIKADSALINKLVGTSALFNSLVARLAVFGGLTANSIAADAILGRHIKAGEKIESPVIEGGELRLIGSAYMKVQAANAFGPDSLVEWYGPKLLLGGNPNWNSLRKSNAITYLAANGDAYFGGSLSAGVLKTGVTNPDKNVYASSSYPVEIGPFGTNGKSKTVVVSYNLSADSSTASSGAVSNRALSWQLQRKIGSGSWTTVSSGIFPIIVNKAFEPEFNHYEVREYCSASSTYTDNSSSGSDFKYRIKVISATRYHIARLTSSQNISLISTEQ
ncbi:hypothetical protein CXF86_18935 [Shewanella sp. GutCb]|uniref:hypothetical protein n=1 Tax=Shewanella sp. GutCb TaxID=2058315 RepID=UPI000C7BC355|nr:hypothetical protein [Shewanella sp. GutCb]PKG73182.1 hypothetical protein CXF86_18935 [Shewanella sp. GutCb]